MRRASASQSAALITRCTSGAVCPLIHDRRFSYDGDCGMSNLPP
jgi:hypothetical protein